jgi:cytochrome c
MPSIRSLLPLACAIAGLACAPARAQDAAAGAQEFLQCADCHSPGTNDGVGPGLKGVYGRRAGTVAGFKYSEAMARSTVVWDETALAGFLADPQKAMPGTAMNWPGESDPKARADLIAYLKTLK